MSDTVSETAEQEPHGSDAVSQVQGQLMKGLRGFHRFLDSRFFQSLVFMTMVLVAMAILLQLDQIRMSMKALQRQGESLRQIDQTLIRLHDQHALQSSILLRGPMPVRSPGERHALPPELLDAQPADEAGPTTNADADSATGAAGEAGTTGPEGD